MEGFYRQEGGRESSYQPKRTGDCFRQGHFPLGGRTGNPMWMTLLVTGKFQTVWFKIPLLGEVEVTVGLGINPGSMTWFNRSDPMSGLCLSF